jgi:hypothetical protein
MAEGWVADIVHQRQSFGHVFVQPQRTGCGAGYLRHFHGVGEAAAKVIGVTVSEDLGFSGEAAKGTGMDDSRPVTLKGTAIGMGWLGVLPLR